MALWDIGFRHIIDVDGQLLAVDAAVIDTASILAKAGCSVDHALWLVRAGERFRIAPRVCVRLSHDEVLFFETGECIEDRAPFCRAA